MAEEKLLKTKMPGYETLRQKHHDFCKTGQLVPAWNDFWAFYNWVMEQGWQPGAHIRVRDLSIPIGPGNCFLKFPTGRKSQEPQADEPTEIIKGGLQNKPCNGCPNNKDGTCMNYTSCQRYRDWINASWAQFNAYWKKHGDRRWLSQD